jgi:NAD(P)H-nitrite reductase large subunit
MSARTLQVIIGNSAAGLHAMHSIRESDRFCTIISISAEKCPAYSPVLLTGLMSKERNKKDLFIADQRVYDMLGVKRLWGVKAVEVNPRRQVVVLENGRRVSYDHLLLAAGALARMPPGSEKVADRVFSLRAIRDAERIAERTRSAKTILVVGAGLIGLQVIESLFSSGRKFILAEKADQVLPDVLDRQGASIIHRELEGRGVTIFLGGPVQAVERSGKKVAAILNSGRSVIADMAVIGMGQKPNLPLVQGSGIRTRRAILVDETMRTNFENVFAAGDIAEGKNLLTGRREILPNWPNACHQGTAAGRNMAGREEKYAGMHEVVTSLFGVTAASLGLFKHRGRGFEERRYLDRERRTYRKLITEGKKIVGAVLVGNFEDAGVLKSLIRNRIDTPVAGGERTNFRITGRELLRSAGIQ